MYKAVYIRGTYKNAQLVKKSKKYSSLHFGLECLSEEKSLYLFFDKRNQIQIETQKSFGFW